MVGVTLRPVRLEDAERIYRWDSDPEVARYLGLVNRPLSVEHVRAWLVQLIADSLHRLMFVIEDEEGEPIGSCGLRGIDREAGTVILGMLIGDPRRWGCGYGTAAARALLEFAFTKLDLGEARLSCHRENARALACYYNLGFQESDCEPPRRVFGGAEIQMAITRAQWEHPGQET